MKRRRTNPRKEMIREAQEFLLWLRQSPRAFVVFNKQDLKALRSPLKE